MHSHMPQLLASCEIHRPSWQPLASAVDALQDDSIVIKERYLGLHMPHEMQALQSHLAKLADLVEAHLDMEQVFQTAATAQVPPLPSRKKATGHLQNGRQHVRIGVAKDGAFAFYYNE